jgi:group I intron endonuclease
MTSTGRVYIIICNLNPKIFYIGSTFNILKQRFNKHKSHYKEGRRCSIYSYFDKYGVENFTMKLLKEYQVVRENAKDNKHLLVYETLWINKIKGSVNIVKNPFNPLKKERKKQYYQDHRKEELHRTSTYYKTNGDTINEKRRINYQNNKEEMRKKMNAKKECPICKKMMNGSNLSRHIKEQH